MQRCEAGSRAITRAKVVSAAGGALGVLVSTEAMENELWAVDLDIIRALICALRPSASHKLREAGAVCEAGQFGFSVAKKPRKTHKMTR